MKTIKESGWIFLLPPKTGLCKECAVKHESKLPHDTTSLYYQTKFQMKHNRPATWKDAMSHCTEEVKKMWTKALKEQGIDVEEEN